jgi:hypothetical protein
MAMASKFDVSVGQRVSTPPNLRRHGKCFRIIHGWPIEEAIVLGSGIVKLACIACTVLWSAI